MGSELLGIGTSSLTALRRTLDTIGHNIANANNTDYNRQITDLSSRDPMKVGNGFAGTGVQIVGTRRIIDGFLSDSLRQSTSLNNDLAISAEYAQNIDKMLGDPNTGISRALGDFFTSIEELNNNPNSIPSRQLFLSKAGILQNRFNDLYNKSMSENNNINNQIKYTTDQINGITKTIANINVQILSVSNGNSIPNDLFDQRDGLIRDLSTLVDVSIINQDDGATNIFVGNGQALVMGGVNSQLSTKNNINDANKIDVGILTEASFQNITNNLSGGKIGGTISSQNLVLNTTLNSLGRLAISISNVMNQQHQKGVDLNGDFGGNMFTDFNNDDYVLKRFIGNSMNTGDAVIKVNINAINIAANDENTIFSTGELPQAAGTLNSLTTTSALAINGVFIRPTLSGDDLVSSSDNQASAIATAKAINETYMYHGVKASAEPNTLLLGFFNTGTIIAGQFGLNNINIVSTGVSSDRLLIDINAQSNLTGVEANLDSSGRIILVAQDGRNIQLTTVGGSTASDFSNFSISAGANDLVQRTMLRLNIEEGEITISGTNPASVGLTAGDFPIKSGSLSASNYELTYNGQQYSLKRMIDDQIISQSSTPFFNIDGLTISVQGGTIKAGDLYEIQPTRMASKQFDLKISQAEKIALAMPLRASSNISNQGTGSISVYNITNISGKPSGDIDKYGNGFEKTKKLSPPLRIEFISENEYKVYDASIGSNSQIGPIQFYESSKKQNIIFPIGSVTDFNLPGMSPGYLFDPGYKIAITGSPKKGDVFTVDYNENAEGDNRNGLLLSQLQSEKLMSSNNTTFLESYTQLVGNIANESSKLKINLEASESLLSSSNERRNNFSGVNLDEEAANLLKFEQAYAASAHLISTARNLFDILMNTFTR